VKRWALFSSLLLATVAVMPILSVPEEINIPIHTYIDYSHERVIVYPSLLTEIPTMPPDKVIVVKAKKPFAYRHPKMFKAWKHARNFCNEVSPVLAVGSTLVTAATFLSLYVTTRR
jgi:hypothetical protein